MERREYGQLSLEERVEIYRLHADGKSVRFIAKHLGRSPSTVSRELRRNSKPSNSGWPGGYDAVRAHRLAARRHARGRQHKLVRQPALRQIVVDQLAMERSPEQIAGRLALEHGKPLISPESIYRYIYWRAYSFRGDEPDAQLYKNLPSKRRARRCRARKAANPAAIPNRTPLAARPAEAQNRTHMGHWEADLMSFSKPPHAVLVLYDRKSRFVILRALKDKKSDTTYAALHDALASIPAERRITVTFDNGQEFRKHEDLAAYYRIETFFCDTYAPWQKGGVENAIGRLRRPLPRQTENNLSQKQLDIIMHRFNNTPRKCLGFKTPYEVFFNLSVALQT